MTSFTVKARGIFGITAYTIMWRVDDTSVVLRGVNRSSHATQVVRAQRWTYEQIVSGQRAT